MNLYTVSYIFETNGGRSVTDRIEWHGTKGAAHTRVANLKKQGIYATYKPVDVPTDKPGLIAWLNEHCNEEIT